MRILSRAIFREVFGAALLGTLLFTSVLFLQQLGSSNSKLFEILVRGSAPPATVAYLFLLVIPPTLAFSLPVGTLVGVLIGLGRMSSDGEITAMRASGVSSRVIVGPVFVLALMMTIAAGVTTIWLTPLSIRELYRVANQVAAKQLTAAIQPRVFEEQFTDTNTVLYVGDVKTSAGAVAIWHNVFLADLTPPAQRSGRAQQLSDHPVITVAADALATPDAVNNRIQLSMTGVNIYAVEPEKEGANGFDITAMASSQQLLAARRRSEEVPKAQRTLGTEDLAAKAPTDLIARIELHRRFALPLACLLLAVIGIPLGVSSRKSGKSAAFVLTVFLALLYYMGLVSVINLAEQGRLPAGLAVWIPNVVFAVVGIILIAGLERPGDSDMLSRIKAMASDGWFRVRSLFSRSAKNMPLTDLPRLKLMPGVIDTYVLSTFVFWFAALLASFVTMAHVFIFFELIGDVIANKIPMSRDATYHLFLTPKLIYDSAPMAVLVAVLVTFGLLAKNNEVTAMKACGVSLYRLSIPIVLASVVLSGALFAFDHYYIPEANRIQDGILSEIKGRPVQTFLHPERKWIKGEGSRIYYYKYLDPVDRLMAEVNVYDLDPKTYNLTRQISAASARWEPALKTWTFHNGWVKEFVGSRNYGKFQAQIFPELTETPNYFLQEVKQVKQLNFAELESYIEGLEKAGLNTVPLKVQFHKKFSVPVFALIMALLAVPFAFMAGNRGAMAGVGVSFGIAIAYFAIGKLFEEIGNVNQLPAAMAAWSPDAVFALAGLYLFGRMRT
jgi:LPS export ABC transporter permease LptG/LPS export ABC transporter permease LptF